MEFKYLSNAEFSRYACRPEDFQLDPDAAKQIMGYAAGLKKEYPEVILSLSVIFCFGNRGYRVFQISPQQ